MKKFIDLFQAITIQGLLRDLCSRVGMVFFLTMLWLLQPPQMPSGLLSIIGITILAITGAMIWDSIDDWLPEKSRFRRSK